MSQNGHDGKSKSHGVPPHVRLMSLLRPERQDIGILIFFSIITGVLYLATPLAVDAVVQNIAFGGQQKVYIQTLLIFSFALLAFLILLSIISAAQHYVAELIQQRIFVRLSADLSFRLPRLQLEAFESAKTQELVNRFLDVTTLQKSTAIILLDGVNVILSSLIGLMVLAFYHPFLLAFDLVLIAVLALILFPLGRSGVRTAIRESYAKHAVAGWLEQVILFPTLFKSPGSKDLTVARTDGLVNNYLTQRKAHYRVLIRQIIGLLALQALASASLLTIGGALVLSTELTLGQLVASELIVSAIVAALVSLGKHIEIWYDALAATDKLGSLVDLPIEKESGQTVAIGPSTMDIELRDLSFGFLPDRPVINRFSASIRSGEIVGVTGPMGSGSGLLLQLIYGLREPTSGQILINKLDMRYWQLNELRRSIALLRDVEIFEGTIHENISLGRSDISYEKLQNIIEDLHLTQAISELPDGIESTISIGGRPFSDTQRVRICVARTIAQSPSLVMIDKMLDGLDPDESKLILDTLRKHLSGGTFLIASRDRDILNHCQRVLKLKPESIRHEN